MRRLALVAAALAVACSSKKTADTTAPPVPVVVTPAEGATVSAADLVSGQVTIAGTVGEAGATVEVQVDGATVASAAASAAGAWSVRATIADGAHGARARAVDGAGNASAWSAARAFTVEATAPGAPVILLPEQGAALAARDLVAGLVVVSGTAEAGALVALDADGSPAGTTTAAGDGAWSIAVDLADGEHFVRARATDAAGNPSPLSTVVSFTLDATPPADPVVLAPQQGATLAAADLVSGQVVFSGTADAASTVEVQLDGATAATAVAQPNGTWSVAVTVADGSHTVRARALDSIANASGLSAAISFAVDGTPPAAPVISLPLDGRIVGASSLDLGRVVVSGSAEPGATVTLEVDGAAAGGVAADGSGSWTLRVVMPDGTRTLRARATDPAGNPSLLSAAVTFTLDTVAPLAPVVAFPAEGAALVWTDLVDGHVVVSGTAEAGATVEAWVGASALSTALAGSAGAWSAPFYLPSGAYTVRARAIDAAGNPSPFSADVAFSVDTTRLALPIPAGAPAPVTSWGQTVPVTAADASGLGELFPGQANSWVLAPDYSLAAGFGLEYSNALVLYTGAPTAPPDHATLKSDLLAGVYDQFPGTQTAAEATFLTPLFGVPDGVVTAAASDGVAMGVPPLSGAMSGFLNGTSDSRLGRALTLDPARTYTFTWTHQAVLVSGALSGAPPPLYQVVLRDPSSGAVLSTLFSSSASVVAASHSVTMGGLPAQVVLSFELRSAAPGYAEIDDVTVAGTAAVLANGNFEAGLAWWVANDGAESQNVRSGARDVGSAGSALRITRTFYAPPGATWGRLVDVFENAGTADVQTHAIYLTLLGGASPLATVTPDSTGLVAWDGAATVRDLGIVTSSPGVSGGVPFHADGDPFVFLYHDLTVPAGGRVALAHFVVQLGEAAGGATSAGVPAGTAAECAAIAAGYRAVDAYRADYEPGVGALVTNF